MIPLYGNIIPATDIVFVFTSLATASVHLKPNRDLLEVREQVPGVVMELLIIVSVPVSGLQESEARFCRVILLEEKCS
jgi:hypothetical protein